MAQPFDDGIARKRSLTPLRKRARGNTLAAPVVDGRAGTPSRRSARASASRSAQDIPAEDAKLRMFVADMYAAMALLRLLRQEIASALSLSSAEYSVLLAVWYLERGNDLTLRAIADHLHVAAAYVTTEVARLVDKGLLTKKPDPVDRRAVGVELTLSAREMLTPLAPMLRDVNASLLAGVSLSELGPVHRFFKAIIANGYDAIGTARRFGVR
jgi:MarR family transcriptional regulator, organic hydroperoxide resistance regulator